MAETYVCISKCYYGPKESKKLFEVGDLLPKGWEPGKHFVKMRDYRKAISLKDDPRTMIQLLTDLKHHRYGVTLDPKTTTREELIARWLEAESKAMQDPSPEEKARKSSSQRSRAASGVLTRSPTDQELASSE